MSYTESAARASQWLHDLVQELSGLRNATSRDPSFKNWRQNALTMLQRIWPADQEHAERFRRIPFSPVDPRADVRAQRESFSRGCQEAARVLTSFIEEIAALGVPEIIGDRPATEESGFEDGFPTVDLPSGDLSDAPPMQPDHGLAELPPQRIDPAFMPPPGLHMPAPAAAPSDPRPVRKGLGVAAKLRDLLGLTGFTGKATPQPPPTRATGNSTALPAPLPRALDIVPVGDEVEAGPRAREWPAPKPADAAPVAPPAPVATNAPPAETGMSVVMSRPTTLRTSIEKVSIESLISPEFRGGTETSSPPPAAVTPPAANAAPAPPAATPPASAAVTPAASTPSDPTPSGTRPATSKILAATKRASRPTADTTAPPAPSAVTQRPPLSIVPPLAGDPEFNVDPEPAAPAADVTVKSAQPTSKVLPLPLPPTARSPEPSPEEAGDDDADDAPDADVDAEEFARAAEDFMRSSPVLGATGRKVQRPAPEPAAHGFSDPDAIAVMSMVDELTELGVPASRQSEARARLLDLARRMEAADLEWKVLRKAVWFAMEYPELARRLMPLLLPWIDRAA